MLPLAHRIAFLLFALVTIGFAARGFYRLVRRIQAGRADSDARLDHLPRRLWYSLVTTLTQSRTFRKRPVVSFFHSFIFYGFTFYILVNAVDALDGFTQLAITSESPLGAAYNLAADVLSALVLIGVVALVLRRFLLPSRRDFSFNANTLLHEDVRHHYITRDSILVSVFILFHVGSRAVEMGAKLALQGGDRFQPFATWLSHAFTAHDAEAWRIFGFWGALGSVLAFLVYFPYSKHIHIFMASAKYVVARESPSGVLPAMDLELESEEQTLGANKIEELAWPRLLDAYACIQCNRCQDVCPATATGKSLSPSALEINKRMELNTLAKRMPQFENGVASPRPLLTFALTPEAAWACTTCGACMQACPVQDEPMLDIIDIRRQQVMMEGTFPAQLQTAFRGMERAKNPWGIAREQRMAWAKGLAVPTIEENAEPDVLYWVGCAASYDPQAQKTARAFVQLLQHAGVNFSVLGKKECCTGDTARRAGNEPLYQQLAGQNVQTLQSYKPKLIVATCPHCMNSIGKEYRQLGGDFKVMHHTEYLDSLVAEGKLSARATSESVAYHDPCYLGRHNGVYEAPRSLLHILSNDVRELERTRENAFCCGAGGAQFWKEEEDGSERISDNRYREAQRTLAEGPDKKVLAVGCPFCKSMLQSTPGKDHGEEIAVKDVAELLWESIVGSRPEEASADTAAIFASPGVTPIAVVPSIVEVAKETAEVTPRENGAPEPAKVLVATPSATARAKWAPGGAKGNQKVSTVPEVSQSGSDPTRSEDTPAPSSAEGLSASAESGTADRPKQSSPSDAEAATAPKDNPHPEVQQPSRKKWAPKAADRHAADADTSLLSPGPTEPQPSASDSRRDEVSMGPPENRETPAAARKKWTPKNPGT